MYNTSSEIRQAIDGSGRMWKYKAVINGVEYYDLKDFKLTCSFMADDISFGNANIASLTGTILNLPSTLQIKGQRIQFYLGIYLTNMDETSIQYLNLGAFNIITSSRVENAVTITAYDDMYKTDIGYFTDLKGVQDFDTVVADLCKKAGIPNGVPSYKYKIDVEKLKGLKIREALGYMAGFLGFNACIERDGKMLFRGLRYGSVKEFTAARFNDPLTIAESDTKVGKIVCVTGKEEDSPTYESGNGIGKTINMSNPFMTQNHLDNVYNTLQPFTLRACSLNMVMGDPTIELGDLITVIDRNGNKYNVPVFSYTLILNGGCQCKIDTKIKEDVETNYEFQGSLTQRVERNYSEYVSTRELLAETIIANDGKFQVIDTNYLNVTKELTAYSGHFQTIDSDLAKLKQADIDNLNAINGRFQNVETNYLKVTEADLKYATISKLESEYATIVNLDAIQAQINKIIAGSITTDYLEANFAKIDLANIKDGCITTAMIGKGVIGTVQIADSSITDAKIVSLTANKLSAGTIDAANIDVINLNCANLTVGTINGQQIANGAIDFSKLNDAVESTITNADSNANKAIQDALNAFNKAVEANKAATNAQATANGKNKAYYQDTAPSGTSYVIGDIWFNTSKNMQMAHWTGSKWQVDTFGSDAITAGSISAEKISNDVTTKINNAFDTATNAFNTANDTVTKTIFSVSVMYALNTSETTAPTSGWQATAPKWENGKYMWQKTVTTYGNGTTKESAPTCITGAKGNDGANGTSGKDGKGIETSSVTYQASTSGSTVPSGDWTIDIPTVSANQYLWTRTIITYTDNTTSTGYSIGKIGANGTNGKNGVDGKGIKSTEVTYQASSSGTTTPTGTWTTTIPSVAANQYLWSRTVITYTDSSTSTSYSIGKMGAQGPQGDKGATGPIGATGKGVKSIVDQYYLSTSNTTQTGGSWKNTQDAWTSGKYIWTRSEVTWSDNTVTYTTPVLADALNTANSAAITAQNLANSINAIVDANKANWDKAPSALDVANTVKSAIDSNKSKWDTAATNASTAIANASKAQTSADNAKSVADAVTTIVNANKSNWDKAGTALSTANGKNTVFYQTAEPSTSGRKANDVWFDTDDGNKMYYWDGSAWTEQQFGTNAIKALSITNALIADGTIQNAKIGNLDAGKITTGYLAAARLKAGVITGDKLAVNTITADRLAISQTGFVKNPNFARWRGTFPDGCSDWSTSTSRIAKIAVNGLNVVQMTTGTSQTGLTLGSSSGTGGFFSQGLSLDGIGYVAVEIKFRLTLGTNPTGSGMLIDFNYKDASGNTKSQRLTCNLSELGTALTANTWYTYRKIMAIPSDVLAGQFTALTGYLMGNYTGNGAATSKTIQFASVNVYQATYQDYLTQSWTKSTYIDGAKIYTGSVTANQLAANSVVAGKIATNAVTAGTISANAVTVDKIATNAVTAVKIVAGAVTTDKLGANAVTAAKIAAGTITADRLASKTLTAASGVFADACIVNANIANLAVTGAKIADATISTGKIADLAVTNAKIGNSAITNAKIADATIKNAKIANLDAGKINTGYLNAARIQAGTITGNHLAMNTITANKIAVADFTNYATANEGISTSAIPTGTFGGVNISGGYIVKPTATNQYMMLCDYTPCNFKNGDQIYYEMIIKGAVAGTVNVRLWTYDGSKANTDDYGGGTKNVTTSETTISGTIVINNDTINKAIYFLVGIDDGNSTRNQIYIRNVKFIRKNSANLIVDGAITSGKLSANAVIAGKIAANAVTTAAIQAGAVNADKLATNSVTAIKIAAGTITGDKLVADTITAKQIASRTITANEIVAGTITANEIKASTITASQIASGTITATQIKSGTITATQIATRTITADRIVTGAITANELAANSVTAVKIGAKAITADKLNVTSLSAITSNIGDIKAGSLNIGSGKFVVDSAGNLTATNADLTGTVTATNGRIAGFKIDDYELYCSASATVDNKYQYNVSISPVEIRMEDPRAAGVNAGITIIRAGGINTHTLQVFGPVAFDSTLNVSTINFGSVGSIYVSGSTLYLKIGGKAINLAKVLAVNSESDGYLDVSTIS